MNRDDRKQQIYNKIGALLVIGIIGGTGLLLLKYSDDSTGPVKVTEPEKDLVQEVKGEKVSSKVNIDTATLEELDKLEGIGPSTAQKIVDHRTQNGAFVSIEQIKDVSGIGEGKFEQIKDEICL